METEYKATIELIDRQIKEMSEETIQKLLWDIEEKYEHKKIRTLKIEKRGTKR